MTPAYSSHVCALHAYNVRMRIFSFQVPLALPIVFISLHIWWRPMKVSAVGVLSLVCFLFFKFPCALEPITCCSAQQGYFSSSTMRTFWRGQQNTTPLFTVAHQSLTASSRWSCLSRLLRERTRCSPDLIVSSNSWRSSDSQAHGSFMCSILKLQLIYYF